MAVSSKALANYLLDLAKAEGLPISPMKLQKLVYYCQGWHLAVADAPLINEQIEAWKFGPVVDTLFHAFKDYGRSPIQAKAVRFIVDDPNSDDEFHFDFREETPSIDEEAESPLAAEVAKRVVEKVWEEYKRYSAERLSNMTHEPGGPWARTVERFNGNPPKGTDIPVDLIAEHFTDSLQRHLSK